MSGLAGIILGRKERSACDYEELASTFRRLIVMSEAMGPDAAGFATVERSGRHRLMKRPVRASHFFAHPRFQNRIHRILDHVGDPTTAILGHARRATTDVDVGRFRNFEPIRAGHIIGTRDGYITNADELFVRWNLRRFSASDGEILFRMADDLVEDGRFRVPALLAKVAMLRGSLSAVFTSRLAAGEVVVLRRNRPLELGFHSERQIVFYASSRSFLDATLVSEPGGTR